MKIQHANLSNNPPKLLKKLTPRECIEVGLFAIEDVGEENEVCVNLIKKWLDNPKSVTERQLNRAALTALDNSQMTICYVGGAVAHSICMEMQGLNNAYQYIATAIKLADEKTNNKRLYISYAKSLFSTIDDQNQFFQNLNFNDKSDILIFFDYLTEYYPDHNVFTNSLNIPGPYEIKGKDLHELAEKISKDKFGRAYLRRLFQE